MARGKKTTTALANWDEELAKHAVIVAEMEQSSAGGQFFSFRGGQLKFNDAPIPNNTMAVIILDHIFENVMYEGKFDPENQAGPICFAFGRDEKTLTPHKDAVNKQAENCGVCPNNAWGSAAEGRGKACGNRRRLAMIPAGHIESGQFEVYDDEFFNIAPIAFMKLPVTSIKGFASFVQQVALQAKRPPFGIFTKVQVVPDDRTQFRVTFEQIGPVPNALATAIMKRREEASGTIDFPYKAEENVAEKSKPRGKKSGKRQGRF